MMPMTTWVKRLLVANIAMLFVAGAVPALSNLLVLFPRYVLLRPWTIVSYTFLHAGFGHLFFNMLMLYFFGPRLEHRLGSKGFVWLYFLSGIGGAVFSVLFARDSPVVGASGAILGVFTGFVMFWPREKIYIYFVLPVEAWIIGVLYLGGTLWAGFVNPSAGSNVAHFAHLGGLVFGYVFVKWWEYNKGSAQREFQKKLHPNASPSGVVGDRIATARWKGIEIQGLHELNREEVVRLLDKVERDGPGELTPSERQFLDRMASS